MADTDYSLPKVEEFPGNLWVVRDTGVYFADVLYGKVSIALA